MTTLAEPAVLAAAKETLYPDLPDRSDQYVVTESQFTADSWGEWSVPEEVRERLRPFNSIRLSSGEPDLLGVGLPSGTVLDGDVSESPVVAVEAKGHRANGGAVDVARGIEQVHSRLSEVNLGYVAVPAESVTETSRSLARELNVGVVGVESADAASVLEPPRVTGAGEFSTGVEAIRFQARTHRLTDGSFPVNHPKNYLGYALALAADGDTEATYAEHVIRLVGDGRRGAVLLGLVDPRGVDRLTHLGREVVRFARSECGSVEAALARFDEWTGSQERFTELAPRWAQLARSVTMQYEPTTLVVDALENLHRDGVRPARLPAVAEAACEINRPLAVEVFFTERERDAVLRSDGTLDPTALDDPSVYKSGLHFQYKAQLYHVGLVTDRGTDDKAAALDDEWALEQPAGAYRTVRRS
ncbi:hypothetical protein [Halobellus rufus]|uniref:hypothetical protein n=1 Tax=Halobellus rufus TaxID=1448860 RepID=UPI0006789604|nr:hypothetical protein [Halobellus rufus]